MVAPPSRVYLFSRFLKIKRNELKRDVLNGKPLFYQTKQYFSIDKLSFTKQNIAFEWKSFVLLSKTILLNGKA